MTTTTAVSTARTSRANRARISSLRSPLTPRFSTRQSACICVSQWAYWLSMFPSPLGGDSIGDLNPGVPAVVESPRATMVVLPAGVMADG